MRKRISKQKDIKPGREDIVGREDGRGKVMVRDLLLSRNECIRQGMRIQRDKIESIIQGTSLESIRFQEIQKNCSFQEFLKKYYTLHHIKLVFTDLIKRNALVADITFMDFKLKNFVIMNNYTYQLRRLRLGKEKGEECWAGSGSSTKEGKHFKEMEMEVKKITKRQGKGSRKGCHNASASFANLLIRNIERMIKSTKEPCVNIPNPMDFKPILNSKNLQELDFTQNERLHTSPDPQGFDPYGLEQFKQRTLRKLQQISQMSCINKAIARSKLNTERSQDTLRYQTQYDTQKIGAKRSKSKKPGISGKKSMGKVKSTSNSKSPFSKPNPHRPKK